VIELVWNALDADAERVSIELDEQEMGGIARIVVVDDGHGMTVQDARAGFTTLGGSWKGKVTSTRLKQRALHGREGRGRFFAATQAGHVRWESVALTNHGERELVVIDVYRSDLKHCEINPLGETGRPVGTSVIVEDFAEPPAGLEGNAIINTLTATFAVYLTKYPVELTYAGTTIDPQSVQERSMTYSVMETDLGPVELDVIEWKKDLGRRLFLCNAEGTALADEPAGIHAPDFNFTAYVRWAGFSAEQSLDLVGLDSGPVGDVLEQAREALRAHFRERAGEEQQRVIEEWKEARVYPYKGEPQDDVAEITRELFDVVAVTASPAITGTDTSRRLSLRLLREAVENDPGALRRVLQEVLELDEQQLADLNELLDRTNLAAVVSAAREVTNRLDFIRLLEELVFEPAVKGRVKERAQLQRILATESWIFGEEFALLVDDESLTNVLRRHLDQLDRTRDALAPQPVTDEDGRTRIVDLMLGRSIEQRRQRREHLVVELKAPSVKIGLDELNQIERYADAVVNDSQFDLKTTRWDFVVVSGELSSTAANRANQRGRDPGLVVDFEDADVRVWAKTWGQIIEDAKHRMKYVRNALGYHPDRDAAVRYLHDRHRDFVPAPLEREAEDADG
jgi:hypothetical protein